MREFIRHWMKYVKLKNVSLILLNGWNRFYFYAKIN